MCLSFHWLVQYNFSKQISFLLHRTQILSKQKIFLSLQDSILFFCFLLLLNYEIRYCFALRACCRVLSQVRLPLPGILR